MAKGEGGLGGGPGETCTRKKEDSLSLGVYVYVCVFSLKCDDKHKRTTVRSVHSYKHTLKIPRKENCRFFHDILE